MILKHGKKISWAYIYERSIIFKLKPLTEEEKLKHVGTVYLADEKIEGENRGDNTCIIISHNNHLYKLQRKTFENT